jgi:hypothetical protein
MDRRLVLRVLVVVAALVALAGCERIMGRQKLVPDQGPLEGNTEVSIYVPGCGDHNQIKEVLFGTVKQNIVSQKEDEVKVRTRSSGDEGPVKVFLILPNQLRCETGAEFTYRKIEQQSINYIFERGVTMGERRSGGFRPDEAAKE